MLDWSWPCCFYSPPPKPWTTPAPCPRRCPHTLPAFSAEAQGLIDILRECSRPDIARLMKLSDALAQLNAARYAAWSSTLTADNARQALFAFNGDVYEGLDAWSLNLDDLAWAQTTCAP